MIAHIFDTETSGLIDNHSIALERQPDIIEYAGMTVNLVTGEVLETIDSLYAPRHPVSEEITKITGITNEMLHGKPIFATDAGRIVGAIEAADAAIAHNLSFDIEMFEIELERLGMKCGWREKICTVEATVHFKGFRLSLSDLHRYLFGEGFEGAHRAMVDVQALVRCSVELFRRGDI